MFPTRLSTIFGTRPDTNECIKLFRMRRRLYHVPSWSGTYLQDSRTLCSLMHLRPLPLFRPGHRPRLLPLLLLLFQLRLLRRLLLKPLFPHLLPNVPLLPLILLLLRHLLMRLTKAETLHLPLQQLEIIDHRNTLPVTENHPLQGKFRFLLMTALQGVLYVLCILNFFAMSQGGWSWSHCIKLISRLRKWCPCEFFSHFRTSIQLLYAQLFDWCLVSPFS